MRTAIGCGEAVRRLWEFLDGGLSESDHLAVDAHLAWCLRCCGEAEFARELRSLLRTRTVTLPPDAQDRLERFIDDLDHIMEQRTGP